MTNANSVNTFDVYAFGMMAASTLIKLKDAFPQADAYAELNNSYENMGGEAANSSIVLSKLGIRVKIKGNKLGYDPEAEQIMRILQHHNIDISSIERDDNKPTVQEIVISDDTTRTILGSYVQLQESKNWSTPNISDIYQCKIVCLDPFFGKSSLLTAQYANEMYKPIVSVDTPFDQEIAKRSNVLIISGEFRNSHYPGVDKQQLFQSYLEHTSAEIIFTSGNESIKYGQKGNETKEILAYQVNSTDTAGAGDSFRAGIIYGLLKGWDMEQTIRFSSALAAIVCTRFPGVMYSPTYKEIVEFMQQNQVK
ncbi:carbohydrate kinase family protein [Cytobacillus sp. Hm23]